MGLGTAFAKEANQRENIGYENKKFADRRRIEADPKSEAVQESDFGRGR